MRSKSIRAKIVARFLVISAFAFLLGIAGIYGLNRLSTNQQFLYNGPFTRVYLTTKLETVVHQQRNDYRDMLLNYEDAAERGKNYTSLNEHMEEFEDLIVQFRASIDDSDWKNLELYERFNSHYYTQYLPKLQQLTTAIQGQNNFNEVYPQMREMAPLVETLVDLVDEIVDHNTYEAERTNVRDVKTAGVMMAAFIVIALLSIGVSLVMGQFTASSIARPTGKLASAAQSIAQGRVDVDIGVESQDEIGALAHSFKDLAQSFQQQAELLTAIANGDMSGSIGVRNDDDVVNKAIDNMLQFNNAMIRKIRDASDQVSAGALQISQGAQSLASGSSQQAATIEEFSSAIGQVLDQTENNSKAAQEALDLNTRSSQLMNESMNSMERMLEAMSSIDESSRDITKIIKVIEDIAFQTNILSLNAAVEAARAGQHGKGFAVVADEVRNLATKSAAAAQETAALIQGSSNRVSEGNQIVRQNSASIKAVAECARDSLLLMQNIARASQEQSTAIAEINQGIHQISQVVQANSATAEQSAAAAEEMLAQSELLKEIVTSFKLNSEYAVQEYDYTAVSRNPLIDYSQEMAGFALSPDDKYDMRG